ncbi:UNKNOWN [Stylonychia lemnae]|uniref:Tim44-like domain-containing protein n=1 Tax=Stylonychia lemnae TaxID=5949 RepID=A0A078AV17_STYLE|nr:UNKNOWN [Stylonychia lemnae]|eukprot:CDW85097.1 UNKNOWN [Stylonychia lemnae]
MRQKAKVNMEKTLSFTQSSFTYKDPYNPKGNILYKAKNKVQTFFSLRNMENEFIDFKTFHLDTQFREIYSDLYNSYRRGDKVILQRSLSESMFEYTKALLKEKRPNPFHKSIKSLHVVQGRNYAETDHLLPEEQWAQLTFKFYTIDQDDNKKVQYNVFERRLADKLSYFDWKLSYVMDEEDFQFIHDKGSSLKLNSNAKEAKQSAL